MAPSQHPIYPDWPSSPADLVPLPMVDGPKLKPFDFGGGPQDIEFLESLGEGLHSAVVRIRIHGQEYAMKIFRFSNASTDWTTGNFNHRPQKDYKDRFAALAPYTEPFYNECRAFGRLQETGRTDLAIDCFGYVLLSEANERAVNALGLKDECGSTDWVYQDCRSEFCGPNDRPPPIRGIVKALGRADDTAVNLPRATARRLLDDVMQMHQLGMVYLDVKRGQFVDWKFADFSTAITTPHFLTSPEITAGAMELSPVARAAVEYQLLLFCLADYRSYELRLLQFYLDPEERPCYLSYQVDRLDFCFTFGRFRYALRTAPRHRTLPYTLVDPRHFDWRAPRAAAAAAGLATPPRTSARARMARLPRWYYPTHKAAERFLNEVDDVCYFVNWDARDGCIYPTKRGYHGACTKLSMLLKNSGGNLDMSVPENKELVEADRKGRYLLDETFVALTW